MSTVFRNLARACPRARPHIRLRHPPHPARLQFLHAEHSTPRSGGSIQVSTLFTILAAIGIGATTYGVYMSRLPVLFNA